MTPDEKFDLFHAENPHVYDGLVGLARTAKARGRKHLGISMLFEVLRWNSMLTTNDPVFKLNNNYQPRYARLIMDQNPDLAGFFELRELTGNASR